jgi:hypothetical protein
VPPVFWINAGLMALGALVMAKRAGKDEG